MGLQRPISCFQGGLEAGVAASARLYGIATAGILSGGLEKGQRAFPADRWRYGVRAVVGENEGDLEGKLCPSLVE